jgi:hypothetical protein
MALITHDRVEEVADFVAASLDHLYEEILGDAQKARDSERRVVLARLFKDVVHESAAERLEWAACVKAANEHGRPYLLLFRRARNSPRRI